MMPPVSTTSTSRPFQRAFPYKRSRVMPGSSPTIDLRLPIKRLKRVLLPTLGRPTIASTGMRFSAAGRSRVGELREEFGNDFDFVECWNNQVIIETRSALLVRGPGSLVFCSSKCDCATGGESHRFALFILRPWRGALPLAPCLPIPARPAPDGRSSRASDYRQETLARCSRDRHRQNTGIITSGDPRRQARNRLHRNEKSPGTALLQGCSFSGTSAVPKWRGQAARLLHEGTQQLSMPTETLRSQESADPSRTHRG